VFNIHLNHTAAIDIYTHTGSLSKLQKAMWAF